MGILEVPSSTFLLLSCHLGIPAQFNLWSKLSKYEKAAYFSVNSAIMHLWHKNINPLDSRE